MTTPAEVIMTAMDACLIERGAAPSDIPLPALTRFYKMAAAAERQKHQTDIERWKAEAATAQKWRALALAKDGAGQSVQLIQQEAAAIEREACAQACVSTHDKRSKEGHKTGFNAIMQCVDAIRARGVTSP
jgi:hypothetical protein